MCALWPLCPWLPGKGGVSPAPLLTSKTARAKPRVLAEAEMFACRSCGKLLATEAMVARSRAMMADHPMFPGENARLMELCNDCRQRAMVSVPPF